MKKKYNRNLIFLLLILSATFLGCIQQGEVDTEYSTRNLISNPSLEKSVTETLSIISVPTQKWSTPTPANTIIVNPTFSTGQKEDEVRGLYETNGECELPCFWGIKTGKNVNYYLETFSKIGVISKNDKLDDVYDIYVRPPEKIDKYSKEIWHIRLYTDNDIVVAFYGFSEYINLFENLDMGVLLNSLGSPDEIWIIPNPESQGNPWYHMALYYSDEGTIVMWSGTANDTLIDDDSFSFSICPNNFVDEINMVLYTPPYFFFWTPEMDYSFSDINSLYFNNESFVQLTKFNSDVDVDNFYEAYINISEEKCFHYSEDFNN